MQRPEPPPRSVAFVLASASIHRARVLREEGWCFDVDPADVDERSFDHLLAEGAEVLALELARRKAEEVSKRHPLERVVAADQVGVIDDEVLLTKQRDATGAVAQLMRMSGSVHRLVNAVTVVDPGGDAESGIDEQVVTMRGFSEQEASAYVRHFEPFECSGSYRLEDQNRLEDAGIDLGPLVTSVRGEDPSGVLGMPVPLLNRLFARLDGLDPR